MNNYKVVIHLWVDDVKDEEEALESLIARGDISRDVANFHVKDVLEEEEEEE